MPKPSEAQAQRLAVELQERMDAMGVTAVMLARRSGLEARRVRALLAGRRLQSSVGEVKLTRLAEVLAVDPHVLLARLDGSSEVALTSGAAPTPAEEGPVARMAVLFPRLEERDQLMVERFVLRLLGQ